MTGIILINEKTGQREKFKSIYAAVKFLNLTFIQVQRAAIGNKKFGDWRVYEDPESIRRHIADYERQLSVLEK